MFVVQLVGFDEPPDYKAFTAKTDADKHFALGDAAVLRGERKAAALFDVPTENARIAVKAVKDGNATILRRDSRYNLDKAISRYRAGLIPTPWS